MRYEKLTVAHCAIVASAYAIGANAYQYFTTQDYTSTIVPTGIVLAVSVATYAAARWIPFGGKSKGRNGKPQKTAPQPTLKPAH